MTLVAKVAALLTAIRRQDVEDLSPTERQRFAAICRRVAELAELRPAPGSGILHDLKSGRRPE
jgi:hypothetical protein